MDADDVGGVGQEEEDSDIEHEAESLSDRRSNRAGSEESSPEPDIDHTADLEDYPSIDTRVGK